VTYSTNDLIALGIAVSFAAGFNVYAVVATLGLLSQAGLMVLPPPLAMIGSWWVIGISLTLFGLEFVADKVPMVDLVWNALQLFVRVPAGAVLAFGATQNLPLSFQAVAAIGGGTLAFVSAGTKLALRSSVTPSPEPFSNLALSLIEDAAAIGLTWFATQYPWLAAAIAIAAFITLAFVLSWILRGVRSIFGRAGRQLAGRSNPTPPG
jgi:hypothetical protein